MRETPEGQDIEISTVHPSKMANGDCAQLLGFLEEPITLNTSRFPAEGVYGIALMSNKMINGQWEPVRTKSIPSLLATALQSVASMLAVNGVPPEMIQKIALESAEEGVHTRAKYFPEDE